MYPNWNFKTNVPELEFGTNSPEVLYSGREIHGGITNLGLLNFLEGKKANKIWRAVSLILSFLL